LFFGLYVWALSSFSFIGTLPVHVPGLVTKTFLTYTVILFADTAIASQPSS
jgi:hypothetical protein